MMQNYRQILIENTIKVWRPNNGSHIPTLAVPLSALTACTFTRIQPDTEIGQLLGVTKLYKNIALHTHEQLDMVNR
jgi:hypothetical protein